LARAATILLAVVMTGAAGRSVAGEAAGAEAPLDAARRLAASDKHEDRVQALRILGALKKPGTALGDEYTYRYAELCLRFHGEGEPRTLEEARKAFADLEKGAGSRWGLRGKIGQYRVDAAEGKRDEAIKGLDRFLGQQTKCERAVEGAYFLGCIYAEKADDIEQLKLARTALDFAFKMHAAVSRYNEPLVSTGQIRARLDWVNKKLKELADGRLKTLFDKAEKLRAAKKYDEARKLYEEIRKEFPGEELAELSGLRVCECIRDKGQHKEAIAKAQSFVAEDPLGAYRGQAHLLIGDICLEQFFDIASSEPEFRCVLDPEKSQPAWVKQERDRFLAVQQAARVTPSAPTDTAGDTWKDVLFLAHERVGIFEYIRKNLDVAAEHFDASQKLQPNKSYGNDPQQGMAILADKIRKKKELIPSSLLGERCQQATLVLLLASLYMEGWRDDRALALLHRVADGEFREASLNQKAYARVKMAEGLYYKKEDAAATKLLKEFETQPLYGTAFAPRALLQLAVVAGRKDENFEDVIACLDKCHARDPYSEFGRYAFFQKAVGMYAKNRNEEALQLFREFAAQYPDSFQVKQGHVAYYVERLKKSAANKDTSGN
jgi:outer membrane protein assembly factor BamD (BamD/ComL family)